jgi:ABC-2 type transport system permease protein
MIRAAMLIARREFVERGRSRVFRGMLAATVLLILGGMFAFTQFAPTEVPSRVVLVGQAPAGLESTLAATAAAIDVDIVIGRASSEGQARAEVLSGEADAALVDGATILVVGSPGARLEAVLRGAALAAAQDEVAQDVGLPAEDLQRLMRPVDIEVVDIDPEGPPDDASVARGVAGLVSALLLFMSLLIFGQFVGTGVVEEKQSRVVEIVLSKVSAATLLVGKVVGIGGLGLTQLLAIGSAVVLGLVLFPVDVSGLDVHSLGFTALLWIVVWFLIGFTMYSFIYATLGATVSRQEDLQSVAFLPTLLLMPPYFIVTLSVSGALSSWAAPMSFVPFWSPLLMPSRILRGDAQAWEVLVTLLGSLAFVVLLVWIGSRVFRGAALRTGGRVPLREAWRAGRSGAGG